MIRAMTPEEEVNLAGAVLARDCFSMQAAIEFAQQAAVPQDLVDLLRAGISCEEIDREMEGEDIQPGESACRYVWTLPTAGGLH